MHWMRLMYCGDNIVEHHEEPLAVVVAAVFWVCWLLCLLQSLLWMGDCCCFRGCRGCCGYCCGCSWSAFSIVMIVFLSTMKCQLLLC